jgi:hypothetical protein
MAHCRLVGHQWFHTDLPSDVNIDAATLRFAVPMTLRCESCDTVRIDLVSKTTGDIEGRRYIRPFGYLLHRENDVPLPRRADWRLGWLDQHIAEMRADRRARRQGGES